MFYFSTQGFPQSGENVPDSGLVPPTGPSSTVRVPDCPLISFGRPHSNLSVIGTTMAVTELEECVGTAGRHDATGNGGGGELLPHR